MNSRQIVFDAIGTRWTVDIFKSPPRFSLETLKQKIFLRVEAFDQAYSRFRNDSIVTQISKKAGIYKMPSDFEKLIRLYKEMYKLTNGYVTPLIGNTLVSAGYDSSYTLKPKKLEAPPPWDDVISYDKGNLITKKPVILDFGACGKGYLVDIVSDILVNEGILEFCVDAGGDMYINGVKYGLKVGLENPFDTSQAIGVVTMKGGALCGSAGNRRQWGTFHHIMNPFTLESPKNIIALWVTSDTTIVADLLTTALFFVSPEDLFQQFVFEYAILYDDGRTRISKDFPAEIFYA